MLAAFLVVPAAAHRSVVTGVPAILIILVVLTIIVLGTIQLFRLTGRGAKRLAKQDRQPSQSD